MSIVGLNSIRASALVTAMVAGGSLLPLPALAQQPAGQSSGPASSPQTAAAPEALGIDAYWTAERLRDARPPSLPTPAVVGRSGLPRAAQLEALTLEKPPKSLGKPGGRPQVTDQGAPTQLLPPVVDPAAIGAEPSSGGAAPEASSSFGAYFTTARVSPDAALTTYPYSVAGKLFFTDPSNNGNFVCSASVLRPRIVVTAGHCVSNPSTDPTKRFFFTNFLFVPAFNNGAAPFGSWTSGQQWVLNAWHNSNGSVPNKGDVAFLIIRDRVVSGAPRKIGDLTGWLGYATNSLVKNHVTMLGYPCNLDACQRMQSTTAGSFASGGNNTQIYGSAARGGASGGPWIQDFGINPVSNPPVALGLNRLVGITSYGPVQTEPKYLGSSILDANFVSVLMSACNSNPGNC